MVKCEKCNSDMPSRYNFCIYCGNKLPITDANRKPNEKIPLTLLQKGVLAGACTFALFALIIIIII